MLICLLFKGEEKDRKEEKNEKDNEKFNADIPKRNENEHP
jgi:hypothetical protein